MLKNGFYLFFKSKNNLIRLPIFSHRQCLRSTNKYITINILPLLPSHTDREIILVICVLIDKLSRSLCDDHDNVDSPINDILKT